MHDLNISILQEFSIKTKDIVKKKHYYICNTDKGTITIKKTFDKIENILLQHEIKEYLYDFGFENTDRYFTSINTKKPYVVHEKSTYIVTNYIDHNETDFNNKKQFQDVIKNIATMHSILRNVEFKNKIFHEPKVMILDYEKSTQEFNCIKKKINAKSRLSDFDVMFIKNFDFYNKLIQESVEMLSNTNINKQILKSKENNTVSHNLLKEENILIKNNEVYITNFRESSLSPQLLDLCYIIRRYMKDLEKEKLSVNEIIHIYSKYNGDFTDEDFKIICPMLKYPYTYLKICAQYYNKNRTWAPSAIISRMENFILDKDLLEHYLYV